MRKYKYDIIIEKKIIYMKFVYKYIYLMVNTNKS